MSARGTEFKVGIFTVLALLVIGYMFFFLSPEMFEQRTSTTYYTVVKNASGIVPKTHVKTNGVVVGKVSAIELEVNRTKISFTVDKNVKIPVGSMVAIKEKGLLGDVFLEIIRANDTGNYLEEGGLIPHASKEANLSSLIAIAGSIGDDIKEVTSSLAAALGGEAGQTKLKAMVENLSAMMNSAKDITTENRDDIRTMIANLKEASTSIKTLLDPAQRDKITNIIDKLDRTMSNVNTLVERIEKGQGTIGKLINDDQTVKEIDGMLKDIREVIAPASRMQVTVDYHGELRQGAEAQHYFNAYLQTRPDKFYLVGLTDTRETTRETTYESLDPEPSEDAIADPSERTPRTMRERITETKALRFNLQFGKRWGDVQLRFGLFESSGGIASDLYLLQDRVKLSFEAFDWNHKSKFRRTAHFKTYVTILFFKHIYTLMGLDDISRIDLAENRVERKPRYFVGVGLNFRDEDLKALFGAAALAR